MSQYILDNFSLPSPDLRYLAYGNVPMWYPPASPLFLAALSFLLKLDLPTVSSRVVPFIEALSPLSIFFLARYMYDETAALAATLSLALTPTFVFWTGISDPQSMTLFLIPLYILFWLKHSKEPKGKNVAFLGLVLALNFLVHLSYFVAILVLLSITAGLIFRKMAGKWLFKDLLIAIAISQIITAPWWLPKNLYWWWIKALVTSSGMYSATWQIGDYGVVASLFGALSFLYITLSIVDRRRTREGKSKGNPDLANWNFLLLLWAIPIFVESQNEAILFALNRVELTWTTLAKPLEGFRFFPFLAQPAALAIGGFFSSLANSGPLKDVEKSKLNILFVLLLAISFYWGITGLYNIDVKFQTSGLLTSEYEAAIWYKTNANSDSMIVADYYRAQMLSGVTGGKALDGGMFPLRNVDLPYISVPAVVQDDLYILYNTSDPVEAHELARKYGVTHIFYSRNMETYGNLLSNHRPASEYGVPIELSKFHNPLFFRIKYQNEGGSVKIFEVF
jgi:4-amino-4-deoxy-L-arabinose transferase-like glycosyltransferase